MSENNNKIIVKNTLYLYIRTFFTMLISLYTSRVVLSVLGVNDYGIYNVIGGIAGSFSFLSSMLSNATQRYLNVAIGKNDKKEANHVFNMNMLIYLIYAFVSILIVEIGGAWFIENKMVLAPERVDAAYWCLHSTVIILFVSLVSSVYESVLIARENMKVYAYMGIYDAIMKLLIVFIVSIITFDKLKTYAVLIALMSISARLIPTIYTIMHYEETKLKYYWDTYSFKSMSKFISWNFIGTVVFILNDQGMNMLLNMFFGPAVNAARGLSVQVKTAVSNFAMGFFTAVRPQIVKSYAAGDTSRFTELIFNSGKFTFFLLWLICFPVMLRIDNILLFWLGNVPDWTAQFVIWILIFNLINCSFCDPVWQGMQAIGDLKKYISIGSFIYLLAFPATWIAFKLHGSPLLAFQILVIIRVVYFMVTMQIFRNRSYFPFSEYAQIVLFPVFKVVIFSLLLSVLVNEAMPDSFIASVGCCLLSVIIVIFSVFIVGLNHSERLVLLETIKKKLCRH